MIMRHAITVLIAPELVLASAPMAGDNIRADESASIGVQPHPLRCKLITHDIGDIT